MDKVYTPLVIPDNPLPGQSPVTQSVTTGADSSTGQVSQPTTIVDTIIPRKMVAQETISETLNTKSKKILDDYSFTEQGSIDIGEYKPGVSGDVRITPNGITARDLAGNTTFDIDGDTGDATFRGTLQAADFVIADEKGLISLNSFASNFYSADDFITTNAGNFVDVVGSELSFVLERDAHVLISFFGYVEIFTINKNIDYSVFLAVALDGVEQSPYASCSMELFTSDFSLKSASTLSCARLFSLGAGTHTIKLRWMNSGVVTANMASRNLNYVILGR